MNKQQPMNDGLVIKASMLVKEYSVLIVKNSKWYSSSQSQQAEQQAEGSTSRTLISFTVQGGQ